MASRYMDDSAQMDRRALLGQMRGGRMSPGGSETFDETAPSAEPTPTAPAAPDYTKAGKYLANSPYGGSEKLQRPWEDKSEKWKYLTVASNFDPSQGLTPEFIAALNAANIDGMKWGGEGDKLSLLDRGTNTRVKNTGMDDVIFNYTDGKPGEAQWNAWTDPAEQARREAAKQGGGMPVAAGAAPSSFQGIQSLMPTDMGTYDTLQRRLVEILGGQQAFDRNALIDQMSR